MRKQTGAQFMKERKKGMKESARILAPRMDYCKEYDILSINWGHRKCDSTVEVSSDVRFDVTKDGIIIGIEIDNWSKKMRENKL
jgi:uncharacterized protein YuzE